MVRWSRPMGQASPTLWPGSGRDGPILGALIEQHRVVGGLYEAVCGGGLWQVACSNSKQQATMSRRSVAGRQCRGTLAGDKQKAAVGGREQATSSRRQVAGPAVGIITRALALLLCWVAARAGAVTRRSDTQSFVCISRWWWGVAEPPPAALRTYYSRGGTFRLVFP